MTDHDIQKIRDRIEQIEDAVDDLQQLGDDNDIPAVERTATRIEGALTTLDAHVPPELTED